jgi:hypothetical protein
MIFNFFKKSDGHSNVVPFPSPTPYIQPLEQKQPEVLFTVGRTDVDTLMTLKMGHTTLTMTKHICKDLIAHLELVSNQLKEKE